MFEAGANSSFWPAEDLGGWRCCHEWAFGKPRILEGMRVGRLGGIARNAAKETLRRTRNPSALLAKVPFGQPRILEVEDLGSY